MQTFAFAFGGGEEGERQRSAATDTDLSPGVWEEVVETKPE